MLASPLTEPTMTDVLQARARIGPYINRPEIRRSSALSTLAGREIWLMPESLQRTGSFKLRGALNRILQHADAVGGPVVTVSSGNHALGVTEAGRIAGVATTVVVPETVSPSKLDMLSSIGANVVVEGEDFDAAEHLMYARAKESGETVVSSVDADVIAGHGTIALEMLESVPDLSAILAPVASGGLLAGCAAVVRQMAPECRVLGVQTVNAPVMKSSLEQDELVSVSEQTTIADGLAGNVMASALPFQIIREHVQDIQLVTEEALLAAMWHALSVERLVLEGAGAATIAAVLDGQLPAGDGPVGIILSGGNVSSDVLRRVVDESQRVTV